MNLVKLKCSHLIKTGKNLENYNYILISAARNEAQYIEKTINSVINQTVLPLKWLIVNDGSSDDTEKIVNEYSSKYDFIELVNWQGNPNRSFGSKARAINWGYSKLKHLNFDYVGILDADVSFQYNYYQKVLDEFKRTPQLGIAGGILFDRHDHGFVPQYTQTNWSVSGPIQMFKRKCFEDIEGYYPLKHGGIDAVAEVMARMKGWKVQAFENLHVFHHRRTGGVSGSKFRTSFKNGYKEYAFGTHPLFQFVKCIYRMKESPLIIGGIIRMAGFFWAFIKREPYTLPEDVTKYLKHEQVKRLKRIFSQKQAAYNNIFLVIK
jgi:glycosyltransferase involved in cell wall biosynthesis